MVSGVWNQLLFLGNRIDGFIQAGAGVSALPSAHLALNLLQHACGEDRPGLAAPEAERLREELSDGRTQAAALERLVALTRGERTRIDLPSLWRTENEGQNRARKLLWTWREALGSALFRALRYNHTRFSPTGQAGGFLFQVDFDPQSGFLHSIQLPHFFPQESVLRVSEKEAQAFFHYQQDLRGFYLYGHLPQTLAVSGTDRHAKGGTRGLPEFSDYPSEIRFVLNSLQGSEPVYPKFRISRRESGGVSVPEIDPSLHKSNARYAARVLPSPEDAVMEMTMQWSEAMTRAVRLDSMEELDRLFPVPEIFLSVASSGAFVGFIYQMPERGSPRGTVYEIGSPALGTQARLHYEVYGIGHGPERRKIRVPTGVRWVAKPNRYQKRAVERWIARDEFIAARANGVFISRSV